MPVLTIAVTYHNESEETINRLFESIDFQAGVDFKEIRIIVVNDTESPLDIDFSKYINICRSIEYIRSDYQNNIGLSRQTAIDRCSTKYIMFCDCDDMLSDALVLYEIVNRISSNKDVYTFDFLQEYPFMNSYRYMQKGANTTWCFGKVYNVDFLKKHNIRFSPKLRYHEDTYFNHLVAFYRPTQENLNMAGYIWKYNKSSITRANNHAYSHNSFDEYLDAIDLCLDEFMKVGIEDEQTQNEINHLMFSVIGDMYNRIQSYMDMYSESTKVLEKRLAKFINKYDHDLMCCSYEARPAINDGISQYKSQYNMPDETFIEFINRIMKENEIK